MNAISSLVKMIDPRDDVSGEEFNEDLQFFAMHGGRNLAKALFWQTVRDLVDSRKKPDPPADILLSARWPRTEAGRSTIEFLMPGVSVDLIIAKLYEDPERFISEMAAVDKSSAPEGVVLHEAGVRLEHDAAAVAFDEKPLSLEEDQPINEANFQEGDDVDEQSSQRPSWG